MTIPSLAEFFERRSERLKMAETIKGIAEQDSGTNLREKVAAVLLTGQVVKFLDQMDLFTTLLAENNRLLGELLARSEVAEPSAVNFPQQFTMRFGRQYK
jgi:hypothetical protein